MRLPACLLLLALAFPAFGQPYYVAPAGDDVNPGTLERPFASLRRAQQAVRQKPGVVFLRGGTYYLLETLVFTAQNSGTKVASVIFQAFENERPVISGGVRLEKLDWRPYRDGIFQTKVPADLRTDWAIYRGGAVLFEGTEDCALEDSFLDQVGGNAVFVNHYNRRVTVRGCHIAKAGASGVCFVGDPQAARNPLFHYSQVNQLEDLDRTPGPRTQNYPADCLVEDCLIYLTGRVEKQTAGSILTSPKISRSATVRSTTCPARASTSGTVAGAGTWSNFAMCLTR